MAKTPVALTAIVILSLFLLAGCTPAPQAPEVTEETPPADTGNEETGKEPTINEGQTQLVTVTLYEWGMTLDKKNINAGNVKFIITNQGPLFPHAFRVEGTSVQKSVNLDEVETAEVTLKAGTYNLYSPLSGDRDKGMEAVITVK